MNKKISEIEAKALAIPDLTAETRQRYKEEIESAIQSQKLAAQKKEEAETSAQFNKACDEESHARDLETFFRKKLEDLSFTARMSEADYFEAVNTIDSEVKLARDAFRKIADEAAEKLASAKEKYMATVSEADKALIALDSSANVLQTKYRYRKKSYVGRDPIYIEDSKEWQKHAHRYGKSALNRISQDEDTTYPVYVAAWQLADTINKSE